MDSPLAAGYEATLWTKGDDITAERLNKIENQLEAVTHVADNAVRYDVPMTNISAAQKQSLADTLGVSPMKGATSSSDGQGGLVPIPSAGDQSKYLRGDGTWATIASIPQVGMSYHNNQKAYLLASDLVPVNGQTKNTLAIADPGVYLDTTSGSLTITGAFSGNRDSSAEIGSHSFAFGNKTIASGNNTHAEGYYTSAVGDDSHAEGSQTHALGEESHAEGSNTKATGSISHAEGRYTHAVGNGTHAEGYGNTSQQAEIKLSGAAGVKIYEYDKLPAFISDINTARHCYVIYNDRYIFVTDLDTTNKKITFESYLSRSKISSQAFTIYYSGVIAKGDGTHAEGYNTVAYGMYTHSEGNSTVAIGISSHAEGDSTITTGRYSHAEGATTTASGDTSHSEGYGTIAEGTSSHAEGRGTIANGRSQHIFGEYNIEDTTVTTSKPRGTYVEIVGNGASNARSNARTLTWSGDETLAGGITATTLTLGGVTLTAADLQRLLDSLPSE